jgi:hypothetical protein
MAADELHRAETVGSVAVDHHETCQRRRADYACLDAAIVQSTVEALRCDPAQPDRGTLHKGQQPETHEDRQGQPRNEDPSSLRGCP